MKIKLDENAIKPTRAHSTDAGLDLYSPVTVTIGAKSSVTINTGVHIELPHCYYGKLESKSGLNVKHSIVCLGGVIDEGYTGAICVKLYNLGDTPYTINSGDKIVQLIVQTCAYVPIEVVEEFYGFGSGRGDNGFGSTGR